MSGFLKNIKKISNFLSTEIWRITYNEFSKSKRFLINLIKIVILSVRGYFKNRLGVVSAGLTYSIAFAIVPVFALFIAISKGFGIESFIRKFLEETFLAQTNIIPIAMGFVEKYLQTMRNGFFIGSGIIILIVSVMNLFIRVEGSMNKIWQVKKSRSLLKQFSTYFTGLVFFPFLVTIVSASSIYFHTIFSKTFIFEIFSPLTKFFFAMVPYLMTWLFFTLIYIVIPNTKVKFNNGLIAGLVAGTLFQIFQSLYINGQINLTRYNAVYGGFAAIPLLLLWVKISSLILLIGAEISYNLQNLKNYDFIKETDNISPRYKEKLTFFIIYIIIQRFKEGQNPTTIDIIIEKYKMPIRLVNQIVLLLNEAGLIIATKDEKDNTGYLPAMDINQITVDMVNEKLKNHGSKLFLDSQNQEIKEFNNKLELIYNKKSEVTNKILLKDL